MEGDSVTLHTDITEIQNDDTILWLFGPKDSVVSQITRRADFTTHFVTDVMAFSGRLQVDQKTGSLTIRNTRIGHSGQYKLSVSREQTTIKIFNVTVFGVVGETDEVKSESVMEGKSVTLWNHVEVQRDDLMVWRFGDKGILLAKIYAETNEISLNNDDERFRDRLQLNPNGSLTIMDTKTLHTGLYELQIRGRESAQRFLLSVTAVPGLSPGVVTGIVFAVLLVVAVLAAVVIYYRRKIYKLQKQILKKVTEGDSVLLPAALTKIEKDDMIQWYYEDEHKDNRIAEFKADTEPLTFLGADERFRGKLNLDVQTGDLSITDIRTIYSGLYILKLSSRRTKYKRFSVSVKPNEESVVVGRSVTLPPDKPDTKIETGDLILWTFGAEKRLVATNAARPDKTDERFTGRVKLDEKTGFLTISNITDKDVGHFKLQIINSKETKGWRVNVILNVINVTEGDSVHLPAALTEIEKDDMIQWYYEDEDKDNLIAEFKGEDRSPRTFLGADGRFRGKLKMEKTGDLFITDIRTIYSGLYILKLSSSSRRTKYKRFSVSVKHSTGKESATPTTPLLQNQEEESKV